jgi:hypothetical protein
MPAPRARRERQRRRAGDYGRLLGLVLAVIAAPVVAPRTTVGIAVTAGLQAATVAVALDVAQTRRRVRRVVLGVVVTAAAVVAAVALLDPYTDLSAELPPLLGGVLGVILALAVPVLIAQDVRTHPEITLQTVAAALCLYLLVGLAFAFAHGLIDHVVASAYTQPLGEDGAIYLSFVTLTTVGFGDITPVAGVARAVTVMEAVVGQIYLVSVVALLVGNVALRRHQGPGPAPTHPDPAAVPDARSPHTDDETTGA